MDGNGSWFSLNVFFASNIFVAILKEKVSPLRFCFASGRFLFYIQKISKFFTYLHRRSRCSVQAASSTMTQPHPCWEEAAGPGVVGAAVTYQVEVVAEVAVKHQEVEHCWQSVVVVVYLHQSPPPPLVDHVAQTVQSAPPLYPPLERRIG